MGLFSKQPNCVICHEECDFPKFQLKDGKWLCQDCLKAAGLGWTSAVGEMDTNDIQNKISGKSSSSSSAEKMYRYAVENGYGSGFTEAWGIKHFAVIQENLLPDETVLMTFIGLHNYKSTSKHDGHFAYAITNKRIIMAQKQVVAGEKVQTVYLDNLNDITFSSGMLWGIMTIDTVKEVFNVGLDKVSAKAINAKVTEVLHNLKKSKNEKDTPAQTTSSSFSAADEIMKFKQLLDANIITEEEFNKKKKELLGL